MNREIKFKYIFQHDDTGRIVTKVFGIEDVENALNNDDYRLYGVVARCQLTGLKDKNGKEIYEGDVLELFPGSGGSVIKQVSWVDGHFSLKPATFHMFGEDESRHYEIIGNIHENPELLK